MNSRKFQFFVSAALNTEFTDIHINFRSVKAAIEHVEFIRKIGDHKNLRYRVSKGDGTVIKTYPKFAA